MRVGVAQTRALIRMAGDPEGLGEVSRQGAPGLINRGLVAYVGRTGPQPTAAYLCRITDAGREFLAANDVRPAPKARCTAVAAEDRVEAYLRRAREAERKAASMVSETFRRDMLDIAMQWRDLARQAADLARIDEAPRIKA